MTEIQKHMLKMLIALRWGCGLYRNLSSRHPGWIWLSQVSNSTGGVDELLLSRDTSMLWDQSTTDCQLRSTCRGPTTQRSMSSHRDRFDAELVCWKSVLHRRRNAAHAGIQYLGEYRSGYRWHSSSLCSIISDAMGRSNRTQSTHVLCRDVLCLYRIYVRGLLPQDAEFDTARHS